MTELTHDTALQALGQTQLMVAQHRDAVGELLDLAREQNEAPLFTTHDFSAAKPSRRLQTGDTYQSIAIYNPSPAAIFVGAAGASERLSAQAPSVPPISAVTLPIVFHEVELAIDPAEASTAAALAADPTAVFLIYVWRYQTVQPLQLAILR